MGPSFYTLNFADASFVYQYLFRERPLIIGGSHTHAVRSGILYREDVAQLRHNHVPVYREEVPRLAHVSRYCYVPPRTPRAREILDGVV